VNISESAQYFPHVQLQFLVVKSTSLKDMRFLVVHNLLYFTEISLENVAQLALLLESGSQLLEFAAQLGIAV
jgi:hypothetical protein